MPKLLFTPEGEPYFVPDDEADSGPIGAFPKHEPDKDQLSQLILQQEGDSGQRSPLRDAEQHRPSEGVDAPVPVPSYEDVVARRAERQLADLEQRRAAKPLASDTFMNDVIAKAIEPERQFGRGALDTIGALPWDIGAGIVDLFNSPQMQQGAKLVPMAQPFADIARMLGPETSQSMRSKGEASRRFTQAVTGAKEIGLTPLERIAQIGGESVNPMTLAPSLATGVITGARYLHEAISPPAQAEQRLTQAAPVIQSVGGPTKISVDELKLLGGLAAVSIGMAFAPKIFSKLKLARVPALPRPVREAVPGTMAISKPGDLARTYDDANAGAMRILRRAGVVPSAADRVWTTMRIQTRATANALTDSAINVGRMETPAFTFQTRVPMAQLAKLETEQVKNYLHVMDTIDELKMLSISKGARQNPHAGPITVRGMNLTDAWGLKNNLEAAAPNIKEISKAYKENLKALRKFETTGEYSTLTTKEARFQNAQRSNYVSFGGNRVTDRNVERPSAIKTTANEMRVRLRNRMQNEAVGMYVDEARKVMPNLFVRAAPEQITAGDLGKNVVTFMRRGVKEHYTTDPLLADVLRMDPYYMQSITGQVAYSTKRFMEMATTGEFAPWFAMTSALRSWEIGKLTVPAGMKSPTLLGTAKAIPQQILPQVANVIAKTLDRSSNGWLSQVFGQGNVQALSTRLAMAYERSLFAQLQTVGGGRGSILQQQISANNKLTEAIKTASGPFAQLLEGYRALLNSVHNAPAFNFASRNAGKVSLPELAMQSRHLTGDPRVGGEFYSKAIGSDRAVPIRFVNESSRLSQTLGSAAKVYGGVTELGRTGIPWFNATMQGVKRIGEAYLDNPAQFIARTWLYQITPAAATYMGARALGDDPNGVSYVDYMMNRRSEYNQMMNFYIPVPGRPAEDGIEFPGFHELTYAKHMAEVAFDHAFRSSIFTEKEDFFAATANFLKIVAEPPVPPMLNVGLASQGMVGPQGPFTGEAYRKRSDPYDQNGGLPASIELYARAITPGIADVVGTGAAAFTQTPKGFFNAIGNGLLASGRRVVEKTPLVRDVMNLHVPITGNTAITDELFKKQRVLRQLESYYKTWNVAGGEIGAKPRSAGGEVVANQQLGPRPPSQAAGINQPPPTNPLYNMFIEEVHNKFVKDNPKDRRGNDTGAIGFQSLWDRYRLATNQLQRIKKVNEGNNVTWTRELEGRPQQTDYLRRNKVDPTDIKQVRNFYEKQRQDAARVLLFTIRGVENDFSKRLGKPFKIEDLNPYGKGDLGEAGPVEDATPSEF